MSIYCGIGDVPKGKVRGTAEQCLKMNQVRYYGIEQLDPEIVKQYSQRLPDLSLIHI